MSRKCALCPAAVGSSDIQATLCREHANSCPGCERDTQRQGLCALCKPLSRYDDRDEVTLVKRGQYYVDRDRRHYALQRIVGRMHESFERRLAELEQENADLRRVINRLEQEK